MIGIIATKYGYDLIGHMESDDTAAKLTKPHRIVHVPTPEGIALQFAPVSILDVDSLTLSTVEFYKAGPAPAQIEAMFIQATTSLELVSPGSGIQV